jgi:hypothetical protein
VASPTATPRHTAVSPRATHFPTSAPSTGGGGTAGLQHGTLFGLSAAAVALGLGFLAYRRKLTRHS